MWERVRDIFVDLDMAKKEFTANEAVAMMHRNLADGLRNVAEALEKRPRSTEETVDLLKWLASAAEEEAVNVDMRDSKGLSVVERDEAGCFLIRGH